MFVKAKTKPIDFISFLLLLIALLVFFISVFRLWHFVVDDAFITFRYSKNLINGYGPVYNPFSDPSEGYTSFLWMIFISIAFFTKIDPVIFSKISGVIFTVSMLFILYRFFIILSGFLSMELRHLFASCLILIICCFTPLAVHTVSGMETSFYTMILVLYSYVIYSYVVKPSDKKAVFTSILAIIAGLTRPEANMFVLLCVFLSLFSLQREEIFVLLKMILIFYFIPGVVYFIWRYSYYGLMFPLPFYVKVTSNRNIFSGYEYVFALFRWYIGPYFFIFFFIGFLKSYRKIFYIILPSLAFILFFVFSNPIMGFEWRFLFPVLPLFILIVVVGISCFTTLNIVKSKWFLLLTALSACVYFSFHFAHNSRNVLKIKSDYANGLQKAHIKLGKILNSFSKMDYKNIIAISDAGAVPYYSMWNTIDTYGLNDKHIVFKKDHDPDYVLSKNPDIIVLLSSSEKTFSPRLIWEGFLYDKAVDHGYNKVNTLFFAQGYYLWIMVRPDNPAVYTVKNIK